MLKITCAPLYTYHADSMTIVKDKAVLVLHDDKTVKMIDLDLIIRVESYLEFNKGDIVFCNGTRDKVVEYPFTGSDGHNILLEENGTQHTSRICKVS